MKFLKHINFKNLFYFLLSSFFVFIGAIISLIIILGGSQVDVYSVSILFFVYLILFIVFFSIKLCSKHFLYKNKKKNKININSSSSIYFEKNLNVYKKNIFSDFKDYNSVTYKYIPEEKRKLRTILKKYEHYFQIFDINVNVYKNLENLDELCQLLKKKFRQKIKLFHPDSVGHHYYKETTQVIQESFDFLKNKICLKRKLEK